jgi:predicted amidohydrolase
MTFKAAAIQMCSGVDPASNAETMVRLVREAQHRALPMCRRPK